MKDQKNINAIKFLGVDMINQANSGHPGVVLGAADMLYTLFANHLKVNPEDPTWANRDRFVLSVGHGSALLYSTLHFFGFDIPLSQIKKFRQLNSKTPGHPELDWTPGVDATTGPLGQGIAMGVGMAIAEENLRAKTSADFINHKTYILCGDGDLQEGISYEALAIAGRQQLKNLIILMDSNDIQLDSDVKTTTKINLKKYLESLGFHYLKSSRRNKFRSY